MKRNLAIVLAAMLALLAWPLCREANAENAYVFDISGPAEQEQIVRAALEQSSWDWASFGDPTTPLALTPSHPPYWGDVVSDKQYQAVGEIPFPLKFADQVVGVSYYPSGRIYIDSRLATPFLREVAMHESAHSRVMFTWFDDRPAGASPYDCYALEAWCELIGAYGDMSDWYRNPVESHAEWFRVTYLPVGLQLNSRPRTGLPAPPNGIYGVMAFHDKWCAPEPPPKPVPPWSDIPTDDAELVDAALWAYSNGIFYGREDGTFGPDDPMLKRHVALVAERTGFKLPSWINDYGVATRSDVAAGIPGLEWLEERWDESITRSQVLRLMYRARDGLGPEAQVVQRLEQWFGSDDVRVTWQGVTRQPRLIGYGGLLVQLSRQYDVPLWLALGQAWAESQWGTTGLAINHNCIWGVKDTTGKWGQINGTIRGFADYVSVEECCRAYYRLMNGAYRRYIDAEDWRGLINKYAPPSENNTEDYYRIIMSIRSEGKLWGVWE